MITSSSRRRRRWFAWPPVLLLAVTFASGIGLVGAPASADAAGITGHTPWLTVLCKFKDQPIEPRTRRYVANFMTESGAGLGGIYDYWLDVSYGTIDLKGSVVKGWYTLDKNMAQYSGRNDVFPACMEAARRNNVDVSGPRIIAVTNVDTDSGALGGVGSGRVVLGPGNLNITFTAHEMGHGYGLEHSFSTGRLPCDGPLPGEYCDRWDMMSAMNVWSGIPGNAYGPAGPGLNAFNLEKLGWLPADRVYTWNPAKGLDVYTLAPLDDQNPHYYQRAVKVPIGTDPQHYYTIEFRRQSGWDRGLPRDGVVIHEIKPDPVLSHITPLSYVVNHINEYNRLGPVDSGDSAWLPSQSFVDEANNRTISVIRLDAYAASVAVGFAGDVIEPPVEIGPPPAPWIGAGGYNGDTPECSRTAWGIGRNGPQSMCHLRTPPKT